MKTFALLSLVAVTVSAKSSGSGSSTAAPAAATTAAVIPTSVSQGCSTFLSSLDSNNDLKSCLSTLNSATGNLTPGSSASDVTTALGSVCGGSAASACSDTLFRTQLTSFLAGCQQELSGSNPNDDVKRIYDALYALAPLRESVCSTDPSNTNGGYCLTTIGKQAAEAAPSLLTTAKAFLAVIVKLAVTKRDTSPFSASGTYLIPNATTFQAASIPFLFLNANTPQATLCSACSQAILKPYLSFESSIADAITSPLLAGQKPLWDALQNQCGSDFTQGVVANAGASPATPSGATIGGSLGAASKGAKISAGGVIAAIAGALIAL